jgi:uncharacterized membrane protein YphA (DoxX/SURF4 family)
MAEPQEPAEHLRRAAIGLTGVRVWLGIWFVIAAIPKIPFAGVRGWDLPVQLQGFLKRLLADGAHAMYRPVVSFAIEHPNASAIALTSLEALAGVLLVFGFFTRMGAFLVVTLSINYWLATFHYGMVYTGFNLLLLVLALCLVAGDAGRYYGIDGLLRD